MAGSVQQDTFPKVLELSGRLSKGADARRIGQYAERWWRWVQAGVTLTDEARMACPVLLPARERRGGAGHLRDSARILIHHLHKRSYLHEQDAVQDLLLQLVTTHQLL